MRMLDLFSGLGGASAAMKKTRLGRGDGGCRAAFCLHVHCRPVDLGSAGRLGRVRLGLGQPTMPRVQPARDAVAAGKEPPAAVARSAARGPADHWDVESRLVGHRERAWGFGVVQTLARRTASVRGGDAVGAFPRLGYCGRAAAQGEAEQHTAGGTVEGAVPDFARSGDGL